MVVHLILALLAVLYVQVRRIARSRSVSRACMDAAQADRNLMAAQCLQLLREYNPPNI